MKLGFGLMRLPTVGGESAKIDMDAFCAMVDDFLAAGGTYFDTAYPYHSGMSEIAFREAVVKRYPRDAYTVTDKMPVWLISDREKLPVYFQEQLEKCGVEYFDYYWLHALDAERYNEIQALDMFGFLKEMKAAGKIRHIGFSFHDTAEVLDRILTDHPEAEFVQLQLNYLDWEDSNVQSRACHAVAVRHGRQVIVMEPVKGGALANLTDEAAAPLEALHADGSLASYAIRFAASLENVVMVLSGMSNPAQMDDNLSYMRDFKPLTDAELTAVWQAAEAVRKATTIGCTACRYCVDGCPAGIEIPRLFRLYNELKRFNSYRLQGMRAQYARITGEHAPASACVGCGQCENACPQHLPVRQWLAKIAEELE